MGEHRAARLPEVPLRSAGLSTRTHHNAQESREVRHEVVVGLTSRSPDQAPSKVLLGAVRQHWTIENEVHWPPDVVWQADRSKVRTAATPRGLATLRHVVRSWLALKGKFGPKEKKGIASQLRANAWDRDDAIVFVTVPVEPERLQRSITIARAATTASLAKSGVARLPNQLSLFFDIDFAEDLPRPGGHLCNFLRVCYRFSDSLFLFCSNLSDYAKWRHG